MAESALRSILLRESTRCDVGTNRCRARTETVEKMLTIKLRHSRNNPMSLQYESFLNIDEGWLLPPARGYAADVERELDELIKAARGDRTIAHNIQQILRNARDQIKHEVQRIKTAA